MLSNEEIIRLTNKARGEKWLQMYDACKQYREEFGDLEIDKSYVDADGNRIGLWLDVQKICHKNNVSLSKEMIQLLEDIGIVWIKEPEQPTRTSFFESLFAR